MQTTADESALPSTSKTLSIPELGIAGTYSEELTLLYQAKQTDDIYHHDYNLYLYSSDTEVDGSIGAGCNNGIGVITQNPGEDTYFTSDSGDITTFSDWYKDRVTRGLNDVMWNIGNYYYTYIAP